MALGTALSYASHTGDILWKRFFSRFLACDSLLRDSSFVIELCVLCSRRFGRSHKAVWVECVSSFFLPFYHSAFLHLML